MKKILTILSLFVAIIGYSQENQKLKEQMDQVFRETKLVHAIDNELITSLMIFSFVIDNGYGIAKGFLVVNNIKRRLYNKDYIEDYNACEDVRLEAFPYSDSLFIIKYKWRQSKDFVVDTCYLFHHFDSYIAYPKKLYNESILYGTMFQWLSGPASTDERDVVQIFVGVDRRIQFVNCEN